jgi:exopolysaccharide biosynthesis WecB/TagA/CpsF family protein
MIMTTTQQPTRTRTADRQVGDRQLQRLHLGGTACDLVDGNELRQLVDGALREGGLLLLASANLDHIHHFGADGAHHRLFEDSRHRDHWVVTLDGMPHVRQARRVTGEVWPPLSGAELLPELLATAEALGATVGVLGGSPVAHDKLRALAAAEWPDLALVGTWVAGPRELNDPALRRGLADDIRAAGVDLLAVCLGKPRQELWLDEFALDSGIRVGACFGGALDCLVGESRRAPLPVQSLGLEWAWRLAAEPRRLWRRYLVQGPGSYLRLRRSMAAAGARPAR